MGYLSNKNIKIFSEITFPMKLLVVMIEAQTAYKMSVFGVILAHILRHSYWIQTKITTNTDTFHAVPTWIIKKIRQLIQEINNTHWSYALRNKNPQIFEKMKYLQNQLNLLTESNKAIYYLLVTRKLTDPMTKSLIRINT